MTQEELAKVLFMTQRKISRLECKVSEPTTDEIVSICKFFNKSADYMLGLTNK